MKIFVKKIVIPDCEWPCIPHKKKIQNKKKKEKHECSMCQKCKWQTINQSKSLRHTLLDRVILTNITKT